MSTGIKLKLDRAVPRLSNLLADETWAKYKWTPDTSLSNEDNLSTLSFAQDKVAFQLKYISETREEIDAAQTDWLTFIQKIASKEERDAEDNRMGAHDTNLKITDILNRADAMYSQLQAKKFELSLAGQLLHNKIQSAATTAAQLTAAPGLTPGATGESHVRLPVLDMTPFRGNKTEWPEFWENYETAVHNSRLPVAEKFLYLRKYVQGEAQLIIKGLPRTEANYQTAIDLLKAEYGNIEFLQFELREQLLHLKSAHSAADCRRLYHDVEKITRQMSSAGEDINAKWIQDAIVKKLPKELFIKVMESKLIADSWNTTKLCATIKTTMVTAEAFEEIHRSRSTHSRESEKKTKASPPLQTEPEMGAFVTTDRQIPPCSFCKEQHWAAKCSNYVGKDRNDRAKTLGLCFKCLARGHLGRNCTQPKKCYKCQEEHHHALCDQQDTGDGKDQEPAIRSQKPGKRSGRNKKTTRVSNTNEAVCGNVALDYKDAHEASLFMSVRAEIIRPNAEPIPVVIFLDSGSHRTFIKRSLADKIRGKKKPELLRVKPFGGSVLEMRSYQLDITLRTQNGKMLKMPTHAVDHMTDAMALSPIRPEDVKLLQAGKVPIASMIDPDILLGVNMWPKLKITEDGILPCGLLLQQSVLGPMICGDGLVRTQSNIPEDTTVSVLTSVLVGQSEDEPEDQVEPEESNIPEDTTVSVLTSVLVGQSEDEPEDQVEPEESNIPEDTTVSVLTSVFVEQSEDEPEDPVEPEKAEEPDEPEADDISDMVRRYFSLESMGLEDSKTPPLDDLVHQGFLKNLKRTDDGRYEVTLPWVDDADLKPNYGQAWGRLITLLTKLNAKPELARHAQKKEWDTIRAEEEQRTWKRIAESWSDAPQFTFPRRFINADNTIAYEIHGFSDASTLAMGVAVYLLTVTENEARSQLLFSKSRVKPIKANLNIPKLELDAAELGLRAMNFVQRELDLKRDEEDWPTSELNHFPEDKAISALHVVPPPNEVQEDKPLDDFIRNSSSSGGEGAAAPKTCGREEPPTSKRNTTRRSELLPSSYRPRVAELTRNEDDEATIALRRQLSPPPGFEEMPTPIQRELPKIRKFSTLGSVIVVPPTSQKAAPQRQRSRQPARRLRSPPRHRHQANREPRHRSVSPRRRSRSRETSRRLVLQVAERIRTSSQRNGTPEPRRQHRQRPFSRPPAKQADVSTNEDTPKSSHRPVLEVSGSVKTRHWKRRLPETNVTAILGQLKKLRLKKLCLKKWSAFRREPWKSSPKKRLRCAVLIARWQQSRRPGKQVGANFNGRHRLESFRRQTTTGFSTRFLHRPNHLCNMCRGCQIQTRKTKAMQSAFRLENRRSSRTLDRTMDRTSEDRRPTYPSSPGVVS